MDPYYGIFIFVFVEKSHKPSVKDSQRLGAQGFNSKPQI